jgi:hypothetical protein
MRGVAFRVYWRKLGSRTTLLETVAMLFKYSYDAICGIAIVAVRRILEQLLQPFVRGFLTSAANYYSPSSKQGR